jgi:hypothetical protein
VLLRITLHDSDTDLVVKLEGCLAGPWVGELESCWVDAAPRLGERRLQVDLRGVCHVDRRGRALLGRLHDAGAEFMASGCEMPEVVREIAIPGRPPRRSGNAGRVNREGGERI